MKIRNAFEPRDEVKGQVFNEPSLTVPDLCYSVRQLIEDGAVGQLPPLSRLAWAIEDDPEADSIAVQNLDSDNFSDIRFADRADAYEKVKASSSVINAVKAKIKAMKEFREREKFDVSLEKSVEPGSKAE